MRAVAVAIPIVSLADSALDAFICRLNIHSKLGLDDAATIRALPQHPSELRTHGDLTERVGQPGYACLIVDGVIARFVPDKDGMRQIVSTYLPGDLANLQNVVALRSDTRLEALNQASILRIPLTSLRRAAARSPTLMEALWRETTLESARVAQSVVNLGRRCALSRLAHLLCELAYRRVGAEPTNGVSFPLDMTQASLGEILGLTAVHVNRMMKRLMEDRIVQIERGTVRINEWRKLVGVGDFDPAYLFA